MEKPLKKSRGNTAPELMTPMEQLGLWQSGAMRQSEALRRANFAVELAEVLWSKMTAEQHAELQTDDQICYLVRRITSPAYGLQ